MKSCCLFDDVHGIVSVELEEYHQMKADPAMKSKQVELERLSGYVKVHNSQIEQAVNGAQREDDRQIW